MLKFLHTNTAPRLASKVDVIPMSCHDHSAYRPEGTMSTLAEQSSGCQFTARPSGTSRDLPQWTAEVEGLVRGSVARLWLARSYHDLKHATTHPISGLKRVTARTVVRRAVCVSGLANKSNAGPQGWGGGRVVVADQFSLIRLMRRVPWQNSTRGRGRGLLMATDQL